MTAGQIEYRQYLDSWRWWAIRSTRRMWDRHCRMCKSKDGLQIHHSSYLHRGEPWLGILWEWMDCITVCDFHHKAAHNGMNIKEFAD